MITRKSNDEVIEGFYAPIILQFGGKIGKIVYTNSVSSPTLLSYSNDRKPNKGKTH